MATAPATPDNMTLDRTDGSATTALYRAALGPVHTDYYLKAFTHFDALGKTPPRWNWTAALLTLNWLLFRQLWVAALAYTGALVATALLLVGRSVRRTAAHRVVWKSPGRWRHAVVRPPKAGRESDRGDGPC